MIEIELPGGVLLEVPTDDLEQAKNCLKVVRCK